MHKFLPFAALLIAAPLSAQAMQGMDHSKMDMSKPGAVDKMDHSKMGGMDAMMKNTPANPYAEDSMAMHKRMMAAMGGDAAETWTRKMIEHHRGAIAMSKTAMAKANDKQTLAMARKTSDVQAKEIAELQMWLKQHGKSAQ